jgi:hypothetical protein
MMDLYTVAKMRQQEMLGEAKVSRLVKAAKAERSTPRPGSLVRLLMFLRDRLVVQGTMPQTQFEQR